MPSSAKVFITGDVHHPSGTSIRIDEVSSARHYIKHVNRHNAKATTFVTGKGISRNQDFWRMISKRRHIELGAHTYWAFTTLNKVFDKVLDAPYGPYIYQYLDCWKTVKAFDKIGIKPISWRTHTYASNKHTAKILSKFGFKIISDRIHIGELDIKHRDGLIDIPINVLNDDNIIAEIKFGENSDQCQAVTHAATQVFKSIERAVAKNHDIVAQLHPICMELLDGFEMFDSILELLSDNGYEFCLLKEVLGSEG